MEEVEAEPVVVNLTDENENAPEAAENGDGEPTAVTIDEDVVVEENGVAENHEETAEEPEVDNPFADDEDSDEEGGGVQVTIRKVEQTEKPAARQGKLDLDQTVMINEKPIYDLDLAQMEDRPWRKPGADITDYFNYGFTEETWNLYCERQKKLRIEFSGNQQAANNALLSSIKISNPLANPIINTSSSVVKVLTDNGGRFKPSYNQGNDQVIRTVISGGSSGNIGNAMPPNSLMDFTKPPPGLMGLPTSSNEAPPGVDGGSDRPPGVEGAPGGLDLHLGLPPLGFNPNMPPPGMPPMGLMSTNMPPPGFSMPPPVFPQHSRAGFGPGPVAMAPGGAGGRISSFASDDDEERRSSRRKRSRSRSPSRRDRDRDSRRRGDRDSERTSSRRHRSRSTSGDRRRRRDDREREKKRERRDDDDRKKRSRRDDDDDRRDRKEKRSRGQEEEEPVAAVVEPTSPAPVVE